MPPSKIIINDIAIIESDGREESSSFCGLYFTRRRTNSLHQPREERWSFPHEEHKRFSFSRLSFKSMMSHPTKFRGPLKKAGRSNSMKLILEGTHNSKDEELVESFRRLLSLDVNLSRRNDDYHTLLRFLRMRAFDLQKAKEVYLKMLKWRDDIGVDAIVKEFKFEEYSEVKKCYPHGFHGVDRYGRPLYIERVGMVDLDALLKVTTVDRLVKYHIVQQEKTLNLRYPACSIAVKKHVTSTTSVMDVKGVGMSNFSKPARELFMEIQKIDGSYYPETLHRLFIVNAGSGFRVLWKALKAFLEPRTIAKIQVLGSNYYNDLVEVIDPSNLPSFLGGNCTCSEFGGCLLKDKGPWNDPEIIELLRAVSDTEPEFNSEMKNSMASVDNSMPNMGDVQNTPAREHGQIEQHRQSRHVDNLVLQKIQELETGLQDTKLILEGVLTKQENLMKQIQELKILTT